MKIDWIKPLIGHPGPFATVFLDVTRSAEATDRELTSRWRVVRKALSHQGAPDSVLDLVEEVALRPTSKPGIRGRVIVADDSGILVDKPLTTAPTVASGVWHQVPALLQAALASDTEVSALRVCVDRTGADLMLTGPHAWEAPIVLEAPHDDVSKVAAGGSSRGGGTGGGGAGGGDRGGSSTVEARVEDSIARNAEYFAREIERLALAEKAEIVLLSGSTRVSQAIRAEWGPIMNHTTVDVAGGRRGAGVNETSFEGHVEDALDSYRERRRELVLAEFREGHGRGHGAVTGIEDVVAVLARGQVKGLILTEDVGYDGALVVGSDGARGPLSGKTLWVGPDPLAIALDAGTLADAGWTEGVEELPAAIALVRAAVGQDASLTFAEEGSVTLIEGVGATLRWHDGSTPAEGVTTMSRDQALLR